MNTYDFKSVNNIADIGSAIISKWLANVNGTAKVINVEKDKKFQKKDIDYIWEYHHKKRGYLTKFVELKVDRYHRTGNFFFETISNTSKNTPGCFMYTEADYVFYYFIEKDKEQLYIINMKEVRPWFIRNQHRFKTKSLKTKVKKNAYYETEGKTVPIHIVMRECPSTRVFNIPKHLHNLESAKQLVH